MIGVFGGTAQKYGVESRVMRSGAGRVSSTISVLPRALTPATRPVLPAMYASAPTTSPIRPAPREPISGLRARGFALPLSIDTFKGAVARAAVAAGADLVNDVTGLSDPDLAAAVAEAGVPVVLQHTRGTPADMASRAVYADVAAEVAAELEQALARADAAGIPRERTNLDPGIGFAKTAEQNVELLARIGELRRLGRPLLVGPSRKRFIEAISGAPAGDRVPGTIAAVVACVLSGVELLRVHDVAAARQAPAVPAAIRGAAKGSGPL